MTTKIKAKPKKKAKKPAGPPKTWNMDYLAKKYDISSEAAQILCKEAGLVTGKHICEEGVYKVGLMELGKHIKHNPIDGQEPMPDSSGKVIEMLEICGKPPNNLRLYVTRRDKNNQAGAKMVCNVLRRVHEGAKLGVSIECEKIDEGLYVHPPFKE